MKIRHASAVVAVVLSFTLGCESKRERATSLALETAIEALEKVAPPQGALFRAQLAAEEALKYSAPGEWSEFWRAHFAQENASDAFWAARTNLSSALNACEGALNQAILNDEMYQTAIAAIDARERDMLPQAEQETVEFSSVEIEQLQEAVRQAAYAEDEASEEASIATERAQRASVIAEIQMQSEEALELARKLRRERNAAIAVLEQARESLHEAQVKLDEAQLALEEVQDEDRRAQIRRRVTTRIDSGREQRSARQRILEAINSKSLRAIADDNLRACLAREGLEAVNANLSVIEESMDDAEASFTAARNALERAAPEGYGSYEAARDAVLASRRDLVDVAQKAYDAVSHAHLAKLEAYYY